MVKRNTEFPRVKWLYKKRTSSGVRYVLHGTKKEGGKKVDYFVTVPIEPDDSDRVFYEKVQKAREELDAKINPVKDIAYYINQYASKRTLSQGSVWQYNHALKGFNLNADNDERMTAPSMGRAIRTARWPGKPLSYGSYGEGVGARRAGGRKTIVIASR